MVTEAPVNDGEPTGVKVVSLRHGERKARAKRQDPVYLPATEHITRKALGFAQPRKLVHKVGHRYMTPVERQWPTSFPIITRILNGDAVLAPAALPIRFAEYIVDAICQTSRMPFVERNRHAVIEAVEAVHDGL